MKETPGLRENDRKRDRGGRERKIERDTGV